MSVLMSASVHSIQRPGRRLRGSFGARWTLLLLCASALAGPLQAQDMSGQSTRPVEPEPERVEAAPEPDPYRRSELYLAARVGDVEPVRRLLEAGADVAQPSRTGLTPLHAAAARGHVDVARMLLANCADRDAQDLARRTPLHLAIAGGHTELADLLMRDGADTAARMPGGTTALRAAERYRRTEIVAQLREIEAQAALQAVAVDAASENGALAPVAAAPSDVRPRGTEGTRRFVQEKLAELGYDPGPIDGQLGGKTREAILAFKARIGQVSRGAEMTRCLVDRLAIEAGRRSNP
jgi:hypothetical protein